MNTPNYLDINYALQSSEEKTIIELRRVNLIIRFDSNVNCISRYSPLIFASRRDHIESRMLIIPVRQIKKYQRRGYKYSMANVRGERVKVTATAREASETVI